MRLLAVASLASLLLIPQPATVGTLFNSADANEWMEAADQHEPGEIDAPLTKIAGWTGPRLLRALAIVREAPSSNELNARLERAALLHADISLYTRDTLENAASDSWMLHGGSLLVQDGNPVGKHTLDQHIPFGRRIFSAMRPPVPVGGARLSDSQERTRIRDWHAAQARNPRIRQWYRATAADFAAWHWVADLKPHLSDAHRTLEDDAGHHFDAGCLAELMASAQVQQALPDAERFISTMGQRGKVDTKEMTASYNLSLAEREYRDALEIDPAYHEARVRLARVLMLKGQRRAAIELLEQPVAGDEPTVRYYGWLTVAAASEREGLVREAVAAYRQASELFPQAQSPIMSTIRLARELGDPQAARDAIARMGALRSPPSPRDDPWWRYYDCNGRHRDREIEALWRMFGR